jgi:hypothetical protein
MEARGVLHSDCASFTIHRDCFVAKAKSDISRTGLGCEASPRVCGVRSSTERAAVGQNWECARIRGDNCWFVEVPITRWCICKYLGAIARVVSSGGVKVCLYLRSGKEGRIVRYFIKPAIVPTVACDAAGADQRAI